MRTARTTLALVLLTAASAAAQAPAGPEFRVNSITGPSHWRPSVAAGPNGDYVVVWMRADGLRQDIVGRQFDGHGAPRGSEFQVNVSTTGRASEPQVGSDANGGFVVVWSVGFTSGPDISYQVFARRFDAAGTALSGDVQVNTYTTGYHFEPVVAVDPGGSFVVVWTSDSEDGSQHGIFGQRFDGAANPLGGQFLVNSYTTGPQSTPSVAMDAAGAFVVVWQSNYQVRGASGIFGQRFDAAAAPIGGEFRVNAYARGGAFGPAVAGAPDGRSTVVWGDSAPGHGRILARRFGPNGLPQGSAFVVRSSSSSAFRARAAMDAAGRFAVLWSELDGDGSGIAVLGRHFEANGAPRGGAFQVNTSTTGDQAFPAVASDPHGNLLAAWMSAHTVGALFDIFAQRFGTLRPAGLAVDTAAGGWSDGNGVLEPNEVVDVRPAWQNTALAARALTGAIASFDGPAGATYTVTDGLGAYGMVTPGGTQPCVDCYVVSVTAPSRPALHWDGVAREVINPDDDGHHDWLLHVGDSFTDVPRAHPFYRFVEILLHHGVTGGCGGTSYCPASSTAREQMAVLVLRAKEGPGYTPPSCTAPVFNDVPASSPFCRWIEELARRGVVSGCGGGDYCPTAAVTREQMAVFVLRTLDPLLNPPACTAPMFADVPPSSPFCRWIEELARRGVVSGCGGGNYCPAAAVTREQMSVFISVTFGLTLYGP